MTIKEKVLEKLNQVPLCDVSYGARIPLPDLYRFRGGKKELKLDTIQRLIDYLRMELVDMPSKVDGQ